MADPPPDPGGDHPNTNKTPELPIREPDPISPELFRPGSRQASSVNSSVTSSSHDQLEMDVIEQQLRVEELKLQLAKRKLYASSHDSNASDTSQRNSVKHADKYLRAYQSPNIVNTMTDEQSVDPNGPCAAEQIPVNHGKPEQARGGPVL